MRHTLSAAVKNSPTDFANGIMDFLICYTLEFPKIYCFQNPPKIWTNLSCLDIMVMDCLERSVQLLSHATTCSTFFISISIIYSAFEQRTCVWLTSPTQNLRKCCWIRFCPKFHAVLMWYHRTVVLNLWVGTPRGVPKLFWGVPRCLAKC